MRFIKYLCVILYFGCICYVLYKDIGFYEFIFIELEWLDGIMNFYKISKIDIIKIIFS